MWISARTAVTLASAALLLVVVAVAAPLMPRPNLPSLPEERATKASSKFGEAAAAIDAPERVRAQKMSACAVVPEGAAHWSSIVGNGPAHIPDEDAVNRLLMLLRDSRTVADPRAKAATPAWVVRFVRDDHRVDVMVDPAHDRLVVARDGETVGTYATVGLHGEYGALGDAILGR